MKMIWLIRILSLITLILSYRIQLIDIDLLIGMFVAWFMCLRFLIAFMEIEGGVQKIELLMLELCFLGVIVLEFNSNSFLYKDRMYYYTEIGGETLLKEHAEKNLNNLLSHSSNKIELLDEYYLETISKLFKDIVNKKREEIIEEELENSKREKEILENRLRNLRNELKGQM